MNKIYKTITLIMIFNLVLFLPFSIKALVFVGDQSVVSIGEDQKNCIEYNSSKKADCIRQGCAFNDKGKAITIDGKSKLYYCFYPTCEDYEQARKDGTHEITAYAGCPTSVSSYIPGGNINTYASTCGLVRVGNNEYKCKALTVSGVYLDAREDIIGASTDKPDVNITCSTYNYNKPACNNLVVTNYGKIATKACLFDDKTLRCNELSGKTNEGSTTHNEYDKRCTTFCTEKLGIHGTPGGFEQQKLKECVEKCMSSIDNLESSGGSGGKRSKTPCKTDKGYVADVTGNSFNCQVPDNNTATNANCINYDMHHYGYANKLNESGNWYNISLINAGVKAPSHDENYAFNRYEGTCNGATMAAFCIEPTYAFKDSGYQAFASLNTDPKSTDAGYVRMYQHFISRKSTQWIKKNNAITDITDATYAQMHMAFRLYSFYYDVLARTASKNNINSAKIYLEDAYRETSKILKDNYNDYVFSRKNMYLTDYISGHGSYFYDRTRSSSIQGNVETSYNETGTSFYDGKWHNTVNNGQYVLDQAMQIFLEGVNPNNAIWEVPVKKIVNSYADGVYDITLTGFQEFKTSPTGDSYLKKITCENCTFIGDTTYVNEGASNILNNGINDLNIKVKAEPNKTAKINITYFDRRSAQNILITTFTANFGNYQKEPVFTLGSRDLVYTLDMGTTSGCKIVNNKAFDNENKEVTAEEFAQMTTCCPDLQTSDKLRELFKKLPGVSSEMTDEWIMNGCKNTCNPYVPDAEGMVCKSASPDEITFRELTLKKEADSKKNEELNIACLTSNRSSNYNIEYISNYSTYCSLGCVQEYKFTVPGKLSVSSERYLDVKVPGNSKKTCVTSMIKHTNFKNDYDKKYKEASDAVAEYKDWKTFYDTASARANSNDSGTYFVSSSQSCSKPGSGAKCESSSMGAITDTGSGCSHYTSDGNCHNSRYTASGNTCTAPHLPGSDSTPCGNYNTVTYSDSINGKSYSFSSGNCNTEACSASSGSKESTLEKIAAELATKKTAANTKIDELNAIIDNYNKCFDITNEFTYDPTIKFEYAEKYYMNLMGEKNILKKDPANTTQDDLPEKYYVNATTVGSELYFTETPVTNSKDVNYATFDKNDNYRESVKKGYKYNVNNYTVHETVASTVMIPQATWYTQTGSGKAVIDKNSITNPRYLGPIYPVTYPTGGKTEIRDYYMTFSGMGYKNGLDEYIKKVTEKDTNKDDIGVYACDYSLECYPFCGCETGIYYKAISLNDVFTKGMNDSSPKPDSTIKRNIEGIWKTNKGKATQTEIEEMGENAYLEDNLEYSYTLTPTGMQNIRAYNRTREKTNDTRGFGDFNLKCDGNGNNCTSGFLKDIADGNYKGVTENKRNEIFTPYPDNNSPWK